MGERAGIVTLRRSRLLARLDGEGAAAPAYDASYARFGAPAQAGSSWPRKLRTPRPGPLPANTGDASCDRRVQASYVRPLDAGSATIGSADIVQGGPGSFKGIAFSAWSIEVCAMPESASLVSERWDSTLRLACRIAVRRDGPDGFEPTMTPDDFLASALFGDEGNTEALLKVGNANIAYSWLELRSEASDTTWTCEEMSRLDDGVEDSAPAWRTVTATVILVLDARATARQGSAAFAPFVQALAGW